MKPPYLRSHSPAPGLPLAPDLLVTRVLFKPLEGGASENAPGELKGNVLGRVAWPLQQCMEPARPCHGMLDSSPAQKSRATTIITY